MNIAQLKLQVALKIKAAKEIICIPESERSAADKQKLDEILSEIVSPDYTSALNTSGKLRAEVSFIADAIT